MIGKTPRIATKMKGKNEIEKFRQIAEELASKISTYEGVTGIVFLGGLVRGFVDKSSDIDITVFFDKENLKLKRQMRSLGAETQKRLGIDMDLEVHVLNDFRQWQLSEIDKWEFSRAKIVFDPKREVVKVFKEKLKVAESFWIKRIVVCGEYLKWYCCPPKEEVGTVSEAWIDRGDLVSAHYCLNYAIDLLVSLMFVLNKEFLPAPKWKIHYSYKLKWQPKDYKELIKEAMTIRSFSTKDFDRRLKAIRELWQKTVPKIKEETELTPERISKIYVEKMLSQNYRSLHSGEHEKKT